MTVFRMPLMAGGARAGDTRFVCLPGWHMTVVHSQELQGMMQMACSVYGPSTSMPSQLYM